MILVTGSSGHLGEALMRHLRALNQPTRGIDLKPSKLTDHVGTIADREFVANAMQGVDAVLHTATLHKPHVATHSRQDFVDTNITGTLNLLEEAAKTAKSFIFTSTTSVFGDALVPPLGEPAAWITEDVRPVPKNIYGATKTAAEDLCQLFHRNQKLPVIILRTSRFFPEADDNRQKRDAFDDTNLKVCEFLHRRADTADIVDAHLLAIEKAPKIGFGRYIISATTPFTPADLPELRSHPGLVLARYVPYYEQIFKARGWRMFDTIDRVYSNERARQDLGWQPQFDFAHVLARIEAGQPWQSELAQMTGAKGYHDEVFEDGPFPVE